MSLSLIDKHEIITCPQYHAVLDEFHDSETGEQRLVFHIDIKPELFSPQVLRRLSDQWVVFRSCVTAPIFAYEPEPDNLKWERFVALFGFSDTHTRVSCSDGRSRRLFVNLAKENSRNAECNDRQGN